MAGEDQQAHSGPQDVYGQTKATTKSSSATSPTPRVVVHRSGAAGMQAEMEVEIGPYRRTPAGRRRSREDAPAMLVNTGCRRRRVADRARILRAALRRRWRPAGREDGEQIGCCSGNSYAMGVVADAGELEPVAPWRCPFSIGAVGTRMTAGSRRIRPSRGKAQVPRSNSLFEVVQRMADVGELGAAGSFPGRKRRERCGNSCRSAEYRPASSLGFSRARIWFRPGIFR